MSNSVPWVMPKLKPQTGRQKPTQDRVNEIIQQAYLDASRLKDEILTKAHAEALFLRESATESGFSEGYAQGAEQARTEYEMKDQQRREQFVQQWADLTRKREDEWESILSGLTGKVGEIALLVAQQMVENCDSSSLPLTQIRGAISAISDQDMVQVAVHPDDATLWPEHLPLSLVKDESLLPGEFKLRGSYGSIDGSWENRWRRMKEALEVESDD